MQGGDSIGCVLVIEFKDCDSPAFDEVLDVLKKYSRFEYVRFNDEPVLSLPGLEIHPGRRKVYLDGAEIDLLAKEFDILCLLVVNKGYILTYSQIYEKIWGEEPIGDENNSVGCHIRNLRRKLSREYPNAPFTIRCHRNIGYCLETDLK